MERYPVKGWLLTPSKFRGIKSDAEINPRVQYGMERVAAGIPDADAPCNRDYGLAGVQQSAEQHPQGWQQNCTTGSSHSKGASGWGHQEQEQGAFQGEPPAPFVFQCQCTWLCCCCCCTCHSAAFTSTLASTRLNRVQFAPFPRPSSAYCGCWEALQVRMPSPYPCQRLRFHFFPSPFFNWNCICRVCLHIIMIRGTFVACYANLRPAHLAMNECE